MQRSTAGLLALTQHQDDANAEPRLQICAIIGAADGNSKHSTAHAGPGHMVHAQPRRRAAAPAGRSVPDSASICQQQRRMRFRKISKLCFVERAPPSLEAPACQVNAKGFAWPLPCPLPAGPQAAADGRRCLCAASDCHRLPCAASPPPRPALLVLSPLPLPHISYWRPDRSKPAAAPLCRACVVCAGLNTLPGELMEDIALQKAAAETM
jgi:hypothetical protein